MKKKYNLNDVTKQNIKSIYQNDLDDPGPTSFFRLVGNFCKLSICAIYLIKKISFIVSICIEVGFILDIHRVDHYINEINGDAIFDRNLW